MKPGDAVVTCFLTGLWKGFTENHLGLQGWLCEFEQGTFGLVIGDSQVLGMGSEIALCLFGESFGYVFTENLRLA